MKPYKLLNYRYIAIRFSIFCVLVSIGVKSYSQSITLEVDSTSKAIKATPTFTLKNARGEFLTDAVEISVTVQNALSGKLYPTVNTELSPIENIASGTTFKLPIKAQQLNVISFRYEEALTKGPSSQPILIESDTLGPILESVSLIELPTTGPTLIVEFDSDDLLPSSLADAFTASRKSAVGAFSESIGLATPVVNGRQVHIAVGTIPAGDYKFTVKGDSKLTDIAGNAAGGSGKSGKEQHTFFVVLPQRTFGQHVEFSPYVPPTKQIIPPEGFNPGDFVETRVAQLYYYRDAHRVAQIINRNIRSYNQAAVTLEERRAQTARDDADNATDDRRQKEREAVRAAEQARNAEQQLATAQQALANASQVNRAKTNSQAELDKVNSQITSLPAGVTSIELNNRKVELERNIQVADAELAKYGDITKLQTTVDNLQRTVTNLREVELTKQDGLARAEAVEERRRANQFRSEVSAAETDPDTYVAGDVDSVDPVTQVSISVIGEGLIQLRGPIKGINKIRTMINQIDSPVGQVKIGVFTVQVNGEQGERMERVVGDAEGHIDLARFLVNQSLNLLRRSIQAEAAEIASQCEMEGHYQVDRDRRYLYGFFGRDFIDELYEMNSEFLFTENKLLSLHSMDTVGFNSAMFILALAKNDVRERIVTRFLESVKTELPDAEYDYRRSGELKPHKTEKHFPPWNRAHLPVSNHYHKEELVYEAVHRNALQRYHFRNFHGFFDTGFTNPDTMNPMQREFIRMAQIFKARLVAEMEWKQRVLERGLFEDRSNDENTKYEVLSSVRESAYENLRQAYQTRLKATGRAAIVSNNLRELEASLSKLEIQKPIELQLNTLNKAIQSQIADKTVDSNDAQKRIIESREFKNSLKELEKYEECNWVSNATKFEIKEQNDKPVPADLLEIFTKLVNEQANWGQVVASFTDFENAIKHQNPSPALLDAAYKRFVQTLASQNLEQGSAADSKIGESIAEAARSVYQDATALNDANSSINSLNDFLSSTRAPLDHRKLLNHLIDEQEEKFIELVEGTRAHIAVMDQYLKRLSIAIEDDFKLQFYDPAFIRVREAARLQAVNLSQVERTTVLTNNRAFAKVDPQATMEFDLPKRQIAIKEAFDSAKALVEDSGALMNDPTFLAAFQMMGGAQLPTTVKNVLPGQSMSTDQQVMGIAPQASYSSPGSSLQSLVPEPSVFKLETGTGFQLRPVMQPDGDSVVYDFDYMYTTNIREPVRADEKHIGRIKRHFVHTSVQTGNFELREISRYQVALRVSRTSKGVPLLEDIPVVGAAFRPAASDNSSLQQNIIFGQTNVYATLYDLMGLRWAQQVVDLDHLNLLETEHVVRGRQKAMKDFVFGESSKRVDEFLQVGANDCEIVRKDLYRPQKTASPHHPLGYTEQSVTIDPTGNNFERVDRRPADMQDPPYDRYRHRPVYPERIAPQGAPERIPPRPEEYYESDTTISDNAKW